MEGYSVTEAASVLGVPTERVWELLARGVLAGQPEGETGMRVFLQPRAAPTPSPMDLPPPAPVAREPERELSPFRELLTEFRNLTERYGQALLALGEARGEVASLRSRVDLLEARMDLRLPLAGPAGAAGTWEPPAVAPSAPPRHRRSARDAEAPPSDGPGVAEAALPDAAEETAEEAGERQPRRRSQHRHATERFAEALARAEDPTAPELPDPLHRDLAADAHPDASLPRELPAAEPMPTADEEPEAIDATAAPSTPELLAPEPEEPALEGAPGEEVSPPPTEPATDPSEPAAEAIEPEPSGEPAAEAIEPEPMEPDATPEVEPAAAAAAPEEDTLAGPTAPLAWDPDRYTTDIGEPDWYAEDEPATTVGAAEDYGVEEMEMAASRQATQRAADGPEDLLDRLDELARSAAPAPPAPARPGPLAQAASTSPDGNPRGNVRPGAAPTPVSRAYRRLRRILPG